MHRNEPATFGMLLRKHRLAAGVSQAALAERAGLSLRGVSDLERGARRTPYADTVRRLAEALELSDQERAGLLAAGRRAGQPFDPVSVPVSLPASGGCSRLKILATSREPLGLSGEAIWRVVPLAVPHPHLPPSSIDELVQAPAVRLFVERVRASQHGYRPKQEDTSDLAEISRRLEGIPLAIELAAARTPVLSLQQIAARLADPLQLLVVGSRTGPPRQQTLRATLEWSYDLLHERERRVFERLSVFAGSWTLDAAEDVCAGEGLERAAILDTVDHLVRASLVLSEPRNRTVKFRCLGTVRQFASEQLNQRAESKAVRDRHADFFTALA